MSSKIFRSFTSLENAGAEEAKNPTQSSKVAKDLAKVILFTPNIYTHGSDINPPSLPWIFTYWDHHKKRPEDFTITINVRICCDKRNLRHFEP